MSSGVTATISTKDRYFSTLPLAISAVLSQTVKPDRFILFDDGEHRDLRGVTPYNSFFRMLDWKGIKWEVVFGERKGQVANHTKALLIAQTPYVWRMDDDNIPEPDCLEKLLPHFKDERVAAVGGLVLFTSGISPRGPGMDGSIQEIFNPFGNIQWYSWQGPPEEVDHLYSTFVYRVSAARAAGGYPQDLSPIGHHEETTFSYQMKRAGYRLLVEPKAITWHLRDEQGGIRSFKDPNLWAHDSEIFHRRLREWGVKPREYAVAVLDNGIGDHVVFRSLLPEFMIKNPGKIVIVAACYPEVFVGLSGIRLVSIDQAKGAIGNLERFDVYRYGDKNHSASLEEAFRGVYGIPRAGR
jgi:hypothetical protein